MIAWTPQDERRHIETECTNPGEADVTTFGALAPEILKWCYCGEAARRTPMAEVNAAAPPVFDPLPIELPDIGSPETK